MYTAITEKALYLTHLPMVLLRFLLLLPYYFHFPAQSIMNVVPNADCSGILLDKFFWYLTGYILPPFTSSVSISPDYLQYKYYKDIRYRLFSSCGSIH